MFLNTPKQNVTKLSGLQTAETLDLAAALQGEQGRYIAALPDGGALVIDAAEGHSIASLCLLPKSQNPTAFSVIKVADSQQQQSQRQ